MNATRRQVLNLYRTILRKSEKFPLVQIRRKLKFNIRDAIEFYQSTTNPQKISELIKYGHLFNRILDDIEKLPTEHLQFLKRAGYGHELYKQGVTDLRKWEESLRAQN